MFSSLDEKEKEKEADPNGTAFLYQLCVNK